MTMSAAIVAANGKGGYQCLQEVHLYTALAVGIVVGVSLAIIVSLVYLIKGNANA